MSVPWYLMAKGKGGGGYKTTSGPIVSISDALAAPLRSLLVNIDPVQEGTGDPSPDNVRPISGWSAVNVWRTGKNLLPNTLTTRTVNETTFTVNEDGGITVSGTPTAQARVVIKSGLVWDGKVNAEFSCGSMSAGTRVFCRKMYNGATTHPTISQQAMLEQGAKYYDIVLEANTSFDGIPFTIYPQIELGSTATPYEPYSGNQYTIQLGDTYYGGTLDVANGVLTVTHRMVNFDNYTGTISKSASAYIPSGRAFYWIKLSGSPNPGGDGNPNHIYMKSSIYDIQDKSYLNMFQLSEFAMSIGRDTSVCMVGFNVDDSLSTVDLFRAWLQSASCDVWYPLATPITIPLTPTEIATLQGQNTLWADTGDSTVEYLSAGGANPDLMKLAVAFMGRK